MPALVRRALRESRRTLMGWTIGLLAFLGVYTGFYPSIVADPVFYDRVAMAKFPGPLRDLVGITGTVTGADFLQVIMYQLLGPMLLIMCAAILGRKAIAGAEETGTLELDVTLPIGRGRLVLARFAGLAIGLLGITAVQLAAVLIANGAAGIDVDPGNIIAAHTGLYLVVLFFGTVALAAGAATGGTAAALAVTGGYAVAGYVIETLGRDVPVVGWLRWLSPFHYFLEGRPIFDGWPVGHYLILLGATAIVVLTAVLAFDRRDVGV